MNNNAKAILAVVAGILVLVGGIWGGMYLGRKSKTANKITSTPTTAPYDQMPSTPAKSATPTSLVTKGSADADIDADLKAIDTNINSANNSSSDTKQSIDETKTTPTI